MPSILEKIKAIFNLHSMGGIGSAIIPALCKDVADTLTKDALSAGPGKVVKQDDNLWEYFKSLSGEEQIFLINSFLHGLARAHTLMAGKSQQEIDLEVQKAKISLGIIEDKQDEKKGPTIQIFDPNER